MPGKPQDEYAILTKIAGRSRLSPGPSGSPSISLGIGDDAALFRPKPAHETIITCDWFLEGTHFLRHKHPPDAIGWKCLARAVSDVAAMGGVPAASFSVWPFRKLTPASGSTYSSEACAALLASSTVRSRRRHYSSNENSNQRYRLGEVQTGHAVLRSGHGRAIFFMSVAGREKRNWSFAFSRVASG